MAVLRNATRRRTGRGARHQGVVGGGQVGDRNVLGDAVEHDPVGDDQQVGAPRSPGLMPRRTRATATEAERSCHWANVSRCPSSMLIAVRSGCAAALSSNTP
ncbi:hypothetical protein OG535_01680 [Kitasatospora sp. NBC_00085]